MSTGCPFCGESIGDAEHACPKCDLPLLDADGRHPPVRTATPFDGAAMFDSGERPARAATERRTGQDETLRCVVVALNQAEAEMLCNMLRGEGVPCMVRSGELQSYAQHSLRCEVLVPETALPVARELLRIEPDEIVPPESSAHFFTLSLILLIAAAAAAVALAIAFGS
jgi:hypothetical protein